MSPRTGANAISCTCFPRVSGDEPHGGSIKDAVRRFSPRERG